MAKINLRYIGKFTIVAIGVISYIAAYALGNLTMISFPIAVGVSLIAAALAGITLLPVWQRWSGLSNPALNVLLATVILGGVISAGFYVSNFAFAKEETSHTEKAVITKKYRETRYRSKRVGRNRYVRGEQYYEYYFDVEYSNGRIKPMIVNAKRYSKARTGDTITVNIQQGLYGFAVVKR